jgi:hypothetical protein
MIAPWKAWGLQNMARYWARGDGVVAKAGVAVYEGDLCYLNAEGQELVDVILPSWAADVGVEGRLLVPRFLAMNREWASIDWWLVAFWYCNGWIESRWEVARGSVHSRQRALLAVDRRMFQHAWVNRIALLIRRMTARSIGCEEQEVLGKVPKGEILLIHDVDAVKKTLWGGFRSAVGELCRGVAPWQKGGATGWGRRILAAWHLLVGRAEYWQVRTVMGLERELGIRSVFCVYARGQRGKFVDWLRDPSYDIRDARFAQFLRDALRDGWGVGAHPGCGTCDSAAMLRECKVAIEAVTGHSVGICRQHWTQFSWGRTWRAQEDAGFALDMTLGWDDEPGWRSGSALMFRPWENGTCRELGIRVLPTVLTDSHVMQRGVTKRAVRAALEPWIEEVRAVGGVVGMNWHQRVFAPDFGWGDGYRVLLEVMREKGVHSLDPHTLVQPGYMDGTRVRARG